MGFSLRGAVVLAGFISFTAPALAQPAELPLTELVKVAVRQSPELERARIDLDVARAALLQAQGVEDIHIGATLQENRVHVPPADEDTTDIDEQSLRLTASRTFSTGGTLTIAAQAARATNRQVFVDPDTEERERVEFSQTITALGVLLRQPLLRGAWSTAAQAPIRQAEQRRDAAALGREARARDLVVSLVQAYWQVAFAWRQLEVRKGSLELAEKQLEHTLGAIRAEKVPRSEALAVQAAIAIRKQDVIAGEQELYERSLALRQLGGLEISPDALTVKTEALPASIKAGKLDIAAVVRDAFGKSAELAAAEATRRAAEVGVAAADGAARPGLDLDVAADVRGAGNSLSRALSSNTEDPGYSVTATLTFDHALQRRTERGGQAAARAVLQAAKVAEREARARLAVRATRAVQRAQAALANVALGDEAIGLAEQNITAEQKRFELGKTTNFEVLRRQDELEQARLRHALAIADYLAARADLDGLSGAILPRFGIVMQ
jgi:outer membrane protein